MIKASTTSTTMLKASKHSHHSYRLVSMMREGPSSSRMGMSGLCCHWKATTIAMLSLSSVISAASVDGITDDDHYWTLTMVLFTLSVAYMFKFFADKYHAASIPRDVYDEIDAPVVEWKGMRERAGRNLKFMGGGRGRGPDPEFQDLFRSFKANYNIVQTRHPRVLNSRTDASLKELLQRRLGQVRGRIKVRKNTSKFNQTLGVPRTSGGDGGTCHCCLQKHVKFSGLYCNSCALAQNVYTIDENHRVVHNSGLIVGKAHYVTHGDDAGQYVLPNKQRIPLNVSDEDRDALLAKIEAKQKSMHCTMCEVYRPTDSPKSVDFPALTKCEPCALIIHNVRYFTHRKTGEKMIEYTDSDGDVMQVPIPNWGGRRVPIELLILGDLTNTEFVLARNLLEKKRQYGADKRKEKLDQRRLLYAESAKKGHEIFLKANAGKVISPLESLFYDPVENGEVNSDLVRSRLNKSQSPFFYVSVSSLSCWDPLWQSTPDDLVTLKPNFIFRPETTAAHRHLVLKPKKDAKTWATIGTSRAIQFFFRKHGYIYKFEEGFVGYVYLIYSNNEQAGQYFQCRSNLSIQGIWPSCSLLAGNTCKAEGPFVKPDVALQFTVTESLQPEEFEWKVILLDGEKVDLAIDSDELYANKSGIYRVDRDSKPAAKKAKTEVVDLMSP